MILGDGGKGPSIVELQRFIRERKRIEFVLVTGDKLQGTLRWFDDAAFCLIMGNDQTFTVLRQAVVAYRAVVGAPASKQPQPASAQTESAAAQAQPAPAAVQPAAAQAQPAPAAVAPAAAQAQPAATQAQPAASQSEPAPGQTQPAAAPARTEPRSGGMKDLLG